MSQKMAHKSVTGAARVAVRSLAEHGLRRSSEYQGLPSSRTTSAGSVMSNLSVASSLPASLAGPARHSNSANLPS